MVFAGYPAGPPLGQIPGPRYFPALYHFQDDQKLGGCTVNSMGGFCRGVALGSPVDDPPRSYGVPLFSFCGSLHGRMEPYSRIGKESHPFFAACPLFPGDNGPGEIPHLGELKGSSCRGICGPAAFLDTLSCSSCTGSIFRG